LLKGALIALLSRPNQLGFVHFYGRLDHGSRAKGAARSILKQHYD
jgi:hypothetical protein